MKNITNKDFILDIGDIPNGQTVFEFLKDIKRKYRSIFPSIQQDIFLTLIETAISIFPNNFEKEFGIFKPEIDFGRNTLFFSWTGFLNHLDFNRFSKKYKLRGYAKISIILSAIAVGVCCSDETYYCSFNPNGIFTNVWSSYTLSTNKEKENYKTHIRDTVVPVIKHEMKFNEKYNHFTEHINTQC